MRLATCSYKAFDPTMGVPVRFTYTAAPPKLPYPLRFSASDHAPGLDIFQKPYEELRAGFLRQLDATGYEELRRFFHGIALTARVDPEQTPVVLLATADLSDPAAWCHRTIMADWWTEQGGGLVPELSPLPLGHALNAANVHDELGTPAMF